MTLRESPSSPTRNRNPAPCPAAAPHFLRDCFLREYFLRDWGLETGAAVPCIVRSNGGELGQGLHARIWRHAHGFSISFATGSCRPVRQLAPNGRPTPTGGMVNGTPRPRR